MKPTISLLLLALLLFSTVCISQQTRDQFSAKGRSVFYIENQADFDRYRTYTFPAGSSVLFAKGASFKGQFVLKGSGTNQLPNFLGAYDPNTKEVFYQETDQKPLIEGEGVVKTSLLVENADHWEITNLEVTNTNGSQEQQGDIWGIQVIATDAGLQNNIRIAHCYVHEVNGQVGGKKTGGISVEVHGQTTLTRFHNLIIEDNHIAYVGGVGISNQSSWGVIHSPTYYPWSNFHIRRNRVEHTGRNGIIVRYAINPIVEYNTLAYNSRHSTGHSVFNFNTINCVVQYNEAYGNTSDNPDDIDHGGFDADYNSEGTLIQYNYSHDNNWFCGIMKKGINTDITIRYNISQNERLGLFLYGFPDRSDVRKVKIYNNTFYAAKGMAKRVFVSTGKVRIPIHTTFQNNLFYFEEEAEWGFEPDTSCVFAHNLHYNLPPKGATPLEGDPLLINPGNGGKNIDMKDPNRLAGYHLTTGSPFLGKGALIKNNGGVDFWGNPLEEGAIHIGASNRTH